MTFYECGKNEGYGAQVKIHGGQDHLIDDCMFRDGLRDGLYLDQDPRRVTIQNSSFINNLDDGEGIVTVAQAGGVADLSLREALTIAANRSLPDVITFDPSVFLPPEPRFTPIFAIILPYEAYLHLKMKYNIAKVKYKVLNI